MRLYRKLDFPLQQIPDCMPDSTTRAPMETRQPDQAETEMGVLRCSSSKKHQRPHQNNSSKCAVRKGRDPSVWTGRASSPACSSQAMPVRNGRDRSLLDVYVAIHAMNARDRSLLDVYVAIHVRNGRDRSLRITRYLFGH